MADREEGQTNTPRGADWEVVSLTASAYAAAPGGNMPDFKQREKDEAVNKDKTETSNALFMSGHFVLPSEPEKTEILDQQVVKDDGSESVTYLGEVTKEGENWNLMKLTDPDLTLSGKEQSFYGSSTLDSLHSEATIGALNINDETSDLDESVQFTDPVSDSNTCNLDSSEDKHDGSGTPYACWLKKQAACLYAHAKETNTFWSVFAAAAVLGIVIISKKWQQEKWQVLRQEWKSRSHDEKMRMMAAPISRFKGLMIGGQLQDFPIRGSVSPDL
ncbi:ATG8-interacting protein 2-like [Rutidosis leptorrhynchoides]|uniref:ATG8-interacting protein 2-like n=1 Tax=Rutidosis leptorrhynchoides TaxID=125765 RepID=UPI003A99EE79